MGFIEIMQNVQSFTQDQTALMYLIAEFLGTFFMIFVGCGSCMNDWETSDQPTIAHISLAFGLSAFGSVYAIGHISDGHLNPAISLSMWITRRISLKRCIMYIIAQLAGGIVAISVLKALTPDGIKSAFGYAVLGTGVSSAQGFFIELILTFFLTFVVYGANDKERPDKAVLSPPVAYGLALSSATLFGVKYTGSSLNPARALGPAIVTDSWTNHWIYWLGPLVGAVAAGLLYQLCFAVRKSAEVSIYQIEVPSTVRAGEPGEAVP